MSKSEIDRENEIFQKGVRDFLPYKTAVRIRDVINFSLMVEGEAPELKLTKDEILMNQRLRKLKEEKE